MNAHSTPALDGPTSWIGRTGRTAAAWLVMAATLLAPAAASAQSSAVGSVGEPDGLRLVKIGSPASSFHVTSTLIVGPTESILWDAQYRVSDGRRLADEIAATGTTLKAILISHADHDHYMGAMEVLKRFPGTPVYMSPAGLRDFRERSPGDLAREHRREDTSDVPDSLVQPRALPATTLRVDGFAVEAIDGLTGDVRAPVSTALWIPSLRTILSGDLVFEGIHPWLGDADAASRQAWRESLRRLAALDPVAVVPGHKADPSTPDLPARIDFMLRYLDDYDRLMASASAPEELVDAMAAKYPDLALPVLMGYGAKTWFQR